MNKNHKLITGILVLPLILVVFSCKKKQNAQPVNRAIVKIVDSSSNRDGVSTPKYAVTIYDFTYNKDSTLNKVIVSRIDYGAVNNTNTQIFHYNYIDNKIIRNDSTSWGGLDMDTLFLNNNGMIYKVNYGSDYSYDPTQKNEIIAHDQTKYYWLDGNINYDSDTSRYEYYMDKYAVTADGIQIKEFMLLGNTITRNKNLIKSITNTNFFNAKTSFTYTFDNNNRIIKTISILINPASSVHDTTINNYTISY